MSTAERHDALRIALLDAAERRVAHAGLSDLRARDLAREAGCSLGAIYLVYPDLDALILAVHARTLDGLDAAVRAAGAGEGAPEDRLVALALAYLDWAAANRPRWAALFEHRIGGDAAVPPDYRARQARLFRHVEAPLAALLPGVRSADLAPLARSVFAAVHGVVSLGLDEKLEAVPLEGLRAGLETVVRAIARGLGKTTRLGRS